MKNVSNIAMNLTQKNFYICHSEVIIVLRDKCKYFHEDLFLIHNLCV